jgi:hypothetical protein
MVRRRVCGMAVKIGRAGGIFLRLRFRLSFGK